MGERKRAKGRETKARRDPYSRRKGAGLHRGVGRTGNCLGYFSRKGGVQKGQELQPILLK